MAGSRIRAILERQASELDLLSRRQSIAFLAAYEDARRDILEQIQALGPGAQSFRATQLQVALARMQDAILRLRRRLGLQLQEAEQRAQESALRDLLQVVRNFQTIRDAGLETRALATLAERRGLQLHQHSVDRYGMEIIETIQRELVRSVASGANIDQTARRIGGLENSVLAGFRGRARLISHMELYRAYNDGHQLVLERAAEALDEPGDEDPLLSKADEQIDARNHPFSRALDGLTRPVKGEWRVQRADVERHALAMGKRIAGIVWRTTSYGWAGSTYPAHFHDRGRQVPWRRSWGENAD